MWFLIVLVFSEVFGVWVLVCDGVLVVWIICVGWLIVNVEFEMLVIGGFVVIVGMVVSDVVGLL